MGRRPRRARSRAPTGAPARKGPAADCSADCSAPCGKPGLERARAESLVIPPVRARVLVCLLLAAALAGCQESGFDESKETARPLKVQDALGDIGGTKVPGQGERPATLTLDALDDTLALGVKPVWASVPGGRIPDHLRSAARGVAPAPPVTSLDMAALEAADPDVILASKQDQERLYPDLSRIAP